jgi:general stress protein YciG
MGSNEPTEEDKVAKEDRGFASMDRAKQREIASKGGKAAHQKGTAHEWTSEEARDAGRKGGIASHRRRREMMSQQTQSTANTGDTGNATDDTRASAVEESSSPDEPSSDEHGREHYSR